MDAEDQAFLDKLAEGYKERLKESRTLERPARRAVWQGRFHALALLPIWRHGPGARRLGHSKAEKKAEAKRGEEPLTQDKVAAMSSDEFVALGKEKIEAFLKDNKVPAQFSADMVIGAMKGGQITPKAMIDRMKQMGGGGSSAAAGGCRREAGRGRRPRARSADLGGRQRTRGLHAPGLRSPCPTAPRSRSAGSIHSSSSIRRCPSSSPLSPRTPRRCSTSPASSPTSRSSSLNVTDLGGGVWRVKAVAGNHGYLRATPSRRPAPRVHIPVRLVLELGKGVELVTGYSGRHLRTPRRHLRHPGGRMARQSQAGTQIVVDLMTDNAGRDKKTITAGTAGKGV